MFKKISLITICLLCTVSLSGCWLPILNKEITMPFFEKKPEQAIQLMLNKMADIQTMEYDTKLMFNLHLDPAKLQNSPLSFLNREQPKVLGIDNIAQAEVKMFMEGDSGEELMVSLSEQMPIMDIQMPTPAIDIPFFSPAAMDIVYNFALAGKLDQTDKDNRKNQAKLNLSFEVSGVEIKAEVETIEIGDDIYVKIGTIPFLSMFLGDQFSNQWFKINLEELEQWQKDLIEQSGQDINIDQFNYSENKEKIDRAQQKIKDLINNSNILQVDERLRDEKINNKKCYHYRISLNQANIGKLIEGVLNIFNQEFNDVNPVIFHGLTEDPKFKEFLAQLDNIIKQADGEVWIDKEDFYLHKSTFNLNIDFSGFELGGKKIPDDALAISVTAKMDYKNFNQPVQIEAPAEAKSLVELIESLMPQMPQPSTSLDPNLDTDLDGLFDWEELNVYQTDPQNDDTDGDGYLDGSEVKNGYNPNGEGELEVIKSLNNLEQNQCLLAGGIWHEKGEVIKDIDPVCNCIPNPDTDCPQVECPNIFLEKSYCERPISSNSCSTEDDCDFFYTQWGKSSCVSCSYADKEWICLNKEQADRERKAIIELYFDGIPPQCEMCLESDYRLYSCKCNNNKCEKQENYDTSGMYCDSDSQCYCQSFDGAEFYNKRVPHTCNLEKFKCNQCYYR